LTAAAIGLLATGTLAHLARPILVPLTLACLLTLLLIPAGEWLERLRLPRRVASGMLVLGVVGACVFATYHVSGPAFRWLDRAPVTLQAVGERLRSVRQPVEQVARAAEAVENMTRPSSEAGDGPTVQVEDGSSLSEVLMDGAWKVVTSGIIVAVLVFFLLSSRDQLFRKIMRLLPSSEHRRNGADAVRGVRRNLSVHLGTLAGVNVALGSAVGAVLWLLGYPSPVLWGLMAGFLNFIPYLGAMVGVTVMTLVGFATFDGLAMPLAGAGAYLLLTSLEGLLITPVLLGRRLRLNPVAVLAGVLVLGFLWGVPGALLAVPLMVTAKVVAEHHPRGRRVVVILGR
jgi:predicted PurR-regulated permease PerM